MSPLRSSLAAGATAALLAVLPAFATEYGSGADDGDRQHVPIEVFDIFGTRHAGEQARDRDLRFVGEMTRHHQGAVEMAEMYLADPKGAHPALRDLAQGIIRNQRHEIAVLEVVRRHVEAGPAPVLRAAASVRLSRGVDGLEHVWRFVKSPPPSAADLWFSTGPNVSAFDVQFARPMIEHHRMALQMAMAYNTDPDGRSAVIGPLNYDMMLDQRAEIAFLEGLLDRYPGDVAAVEDDPRMTEIMRRSMAGMQH